MTVTEAVLGLAISDSRTFAVSFELLTTVVVLALPFHFTVEADTKPVPFTVSVKAAEPGTTASGVNGWSMKGTGLGTGGGVLPPPLPVPLPPHPLSRPTLQIEIRSSRDFFMTPPQDRIQSAQARLRFLTSNTAVKSIPISPVRDIVKRFHLERPCEAGTDTELAALFHWCKVNCRKQMG
jgi:hypothetical protein